MDSLGCFVPPRAVQLLLGRTRDASAAEAQPDAGFREPVEARSFAAVLLVDISGFTALAEQLSRSGPDGMERLSGLLNACMEPIIRLIMDRGGEVAQFAGDALIAEWPLADEHASTSVQIAAGCALAIQETFKSRRKSEHALAARVVLSVGESWFWILGGWRGCWHTLISGDWQAQVAPAQRAARPGDVVISAAAWARLDGRATGELIGEGQWRLLGIATSALSHPVARRSIEPLPPSILPALRTLLPEVVLLHQEVRQDAWLAELRRITALFVALPTLGTGSAGLMRAQTLILRLQSVLDRYSGVIHKLSVDEKGAALLAVFGLPPASHEDNALRAVRAALELEQALRALGWPVAIGVTTGQAFCGMVGSRERREYTVIGDVVNVASRLMQVANEGHAGLGIACDHATQQEIQSAVQIEPLQPVRVKGKAEPVAIFRPRGLLAGWRSMRLFTSVCGRDAELVQINQGLDGLVGGVGGVMLIEGEAGIGKSHLVQALVQSAVERPLRAAVAEAESMEQHTPYYVFRLLLGQLLRLDLYAEPARRQESLQPLLDAAGLTDQAPLLNEALGVAFPETELTQQMSGQVRAENTMELLTRLVQQVAEEKPLLIIIEDAHWLDAVSWTLLGQLGRQAGALLLVLTMRPLTEDPPQELSTLRSLSSTRRLQLGNIPDSAIAALLCQRLDVQKIDAPLLRYISERAEGHPLYSEELLYALRDADALSVGDGECRLHATADLAQLNVPSTLPGVMTARIDRLTPQQQLTLKTASVIGRVFALPVLAAVYPVEIERGELRGFLLTLEQRGLVQGHSAEPDPSYLFRHSLTQEAAYGLMLYAQRRQLHLAVGQWYERTHAENLAPHYAMLAHHFQLAEVFEKALDYLGLAGQRAVSMFANRTAVQLLQTALSLSERVATSAARSSLWHRLLGTAYFGLGDLPSAERHLATALRLMDQPLPPAGPRLVGRVFVELFRQIGHLLWPRRYLMPTQPTPLLPPSPIAEIEIGRAYDVISDIYFYKNDSLTTVYLTLRRLNLAERSPWSIEKARAYAAVAVIAGLVPLHGLARRYAAAAHKNLELEPHLATQARVRILTAVYRLGAGGGWDEVRADLQPVLESCRRLGDRRQLGEALNVVGGSCYFAGDLVEAARLAGELEQLARRHVNKQQLAWGLYQRGVVHLQRGETAAAVAMLSEAEEVLVGGGDVMTSVIVQGLLSRARFEQGETAAAGSAASAALRLIRAQPVLGYDCYLGYSGAVETLLGLWEAGASAARDEARQLCSTFAAYARQLPIGLPALHRALGIRAWLEGRRPAARRAFQTSLRHAEQLKMPLESARTQAEWRRRDPDTAPRLRERAG